MYNHLCNSTACYLPVFTFPSFATSSGPVLTVEDLNVVTSAGQPTTLICRVSGTPPLTVTWIHEGQPIEDERILVLADHTLFIQNTCLEVRSDNSMGDVTNACE